MPSLSRRAFIARLWPVAVWPLVTGHHRPNHSGGPQPSPSPPPTPSGQPVTVAAAAGTASTVFPAGGYVETVEW